MSYDLRNLVKHSAISFSGEPDSISFPTFIVSETDEGMKLTLDTDAYAENVQSSDYLAVTDRLHAAIVEEFEASIREPVYQHMRRAQGTNNAT